MGPILLWCHFRSQGVQWPLREEDCVEVRNHRQEVVGEIPGYLVIELIAHYFRGLQLQIELGGLRSPNGGPLALPPPPKMPPRPVPIELQESRRERRRHPRRKMAMWWALTWIALVACCREREDVGARLQRECESIIRRGGDAPNEANFNYQVRRCILERGRAQ